MKPFVIALLFVSLSGCGLEVAGTAATGASIKKQELEQGQKTMQNMQEQIGQMNMEATDRLDSADDD
jgi:hypothetical protein